MPGSLRKGKFFGKAKRAVFPNLRPSTRTISLRLPEAMIAELKLLANKRDAPCQSLLKMFLAERIEAELARRHSRAAHVLAFQGASPQYPTGVLQNGAQKPALASL